MLLHHSTDVTEADTFESVTKLIENYTEGDGLNLVINNAGINTRQGLENVTTDAMMHSYMANVVGPLQLTQVLYIDLDIHVRSCR